jgi:hypothetical protein
MIRVWEKRNCSLFFWDFKEEKLRQAGNFQPVESKERVETTRSFAVERKLTGSILWLLTNHVFLHTPPVPRGYAVQVFQIHLRGDPPLSAG